VSWVFLWLLLGIAATAVFLVFAVSLARHVVIVSRTARRFQDEAGSLAGEVSRAGSATADRAQAVRMPGRSRRR
jgi:hypothetical protein